MKWKSLRVVARVVVVARAREMKTRRPTWVDFIPQNHRHTTLSLNHFLAGAREKLWAKVEAALKGRRKKITKKESQVKSSLEIKIDRREIKAVWKKLQSCLLNDFAVWLERENGKFYTFSSLSLLFFSLSKYLICPANTKTAFLNVK